MYNFRNITKDLFYIGGGNSKENLFEAMYKLDHGMQYNSYLLLDEKTVLFDTIEINLSSLLINNIKEILKDRKLDYLVVQHMEPDHCANIPSLLELFPDLTIVGNKKTFVMINQFFPDLKLKNTLEVKEKDELKTGKYSIEFIFAPMLHWPEVMTSYIKEINALLSADIFGAFGILCGNIFSSEMDIEKNWLDEIRRYYINIVGKFGAQANAYIKKITQRELKYILPLHGPLFNKEDDINFIIQKYTIWANYQSETKGILICSASMYGNSEMLCHIIANKLAEKGIKNIDFYDISTTETSYIISSAHKNSHILISALSYYSSIFPPMKNFLNKLVFSNYQNKKYSIITNASWASAALKETKDILSSAKNLEEIGPNISISSASNENNIEAIDELVNNIYKSLTE